MQTKISLTAPRLKSLAFLLCAASPFMTGALQAQSIVITPNYETIGVNQTLQYKAAVTGLTDTGVTWSVGGWMAYGTITTGGLYTAPATIPPNGITITA